MASSGGDKNGHEGQVLEDITLETPSEPVATEEKEQPATAEQERAAVFSSPLENIEEEEEEEEEIDREALLQEVKEALGEQEKLRAVNSQLQHKLAEYLSRKKTEEQADPGRSVTDQEKRYLQCMAALESLEVELAIMCDNFLRQEHQLMAFGNMKMVEVDEATVEFSGYKREQALTAVHSRTGKRLTVQEVERCLSLEGRREEEVVQARLENIKLMNRTHKLEVLIKQKDQLAEGLHMIDFEQLKISNVDLNEKIEERNEDILKLKSKVTDTVQVLTHVKEKLQFVQGENAGKKLSLQELEAVVARERDHLTRIKQARDALRTDNLRLRQKGGLVSHPALLRDYEERRDQAVELSERLECLGKRHSELTVLCDGLRRRIEQARALHTHM